MPILRPKQREQQYPNLLPEARVYGTNKDKMTDDQLNLLAGKGDSKNLFSTQANESVWNSWAENGRPIIRPFVGDFAKTGRASFQGRGTWNYQPEVIDKAKYLLKNGREGANTMTIRPGDVGDYFAELAHANQLKEGEWSLRDRKKYTDRKQYDQKAYADPESIEYAAHQKIEPTLYKKYPMPDSSAEEDSRITAKATIDNARMRRELNDMENKFTSVKLGVPFPEEVYKGRTRPPVNIHTYGKGIYFPPRKPQKTQPVKSGATVPWKPGYINI